MAFVMISICRKDGDDNGDNNDDDGDDDKNNISHEDVSYLHNRSSNIKTIIPFLYFFFSL